MHWKWKTSLHMPHTTLHHSLDADSWLSWHSLHKSMMWLGQKAQVSAGISQLHIAAGFYFITSNLIFSLQLLLLGEGISILPILIFVKIQLN